MKKSNLLNFVNKYFLAGNCESVKLSVANNKLKTNFITADQTVIGTVEYNDFVNEDVEFGVYTTGQLLKLLSALEDDIDLTFNKADNKLYSLTLSDDNGSIFLSVLFQ
mgnify:CR=1 FL=1